MGVGCDGYWVGLSYAEKRPSEHSGPRVSRPLHHPCAQRGWGEPASSRQRLRRGRRYGWGRTWNRPYPNVVDGGGAVRRATSRAGAKGNNHRQCRPSRPIGKSTNRSTSPLRYILSASMQAGVVIEMIVFGYCSQSFCILSSTFVV
jgi:hypothetical protein